MQTGEGHTHTHTARWTDMQTKTFENRTWYCRNSSMGGWDPYVSNFGMLRSSTNRMILFPAGAPVTGLNTWYIHCIIHIHTVHTWPLVQNLDYSIQLVNLYPSDKMCSLSSQILEHIYFIQWTGSCSLVKIIKPLNNQAHAVTFFQVFIDFSSFTKPYY